ncbi:hypothetical protein SLS60_005520 [Paraconiothyrium brasiliense]|uniref:Uncharacterized protein n=1 Tax=Paraconiothyrium brasiliense TaxID=300254 RepID=A0ABR3RIA2_9PLEO
MSTELSPEDRASLFHHVHYGAPPGPAAQVRVTPWSDMDPFSKPKNAAWEKNLNAEQLHRLLMGFQPMDMDDKWLIYSDGPVRKQNPDGNDDPHASVYMYRSWTGTLCFKIDLVVEDVVGTLSRLENPPAMEVQDGLETGAEQSNTDAEGSEASEKEDTTQGQIIGRIVGLTWETDEEKVRFGDEKEVKEYAGNVCKFLLGV